MNLNISTRPNFFRNEDNRVEDPQDQEIRANTFDPEAICSNNDRLEGCIPANTFDSKVIYPYEFWVNQEPNNQALNNNDACDAIQPHNDTSEGQIETYQLNHV